PAAARRPIPSRPALRRTRRGGRDRPPAGRDRGTGSTSALAPRRTLPRLPRHFLTGEELRADELTALIARAAEMKRAPRQPQVLDGRTVALIFEKPSTRTRVSFEVGVAELGGHPMVLRGE